MRASSRSLADLDPSFLDGVRDVLTRCAALGVEMRPFSTGRSPADQARLWRQSRSTAEVNAAAAMLRAEGAEWLADVLIRVGPCSGRWATNALPGNSWHQHMEAIDCYWLVDGVAVWSPSRLVAGVNGYAEYRRVALACGLHRGPLNDWPHIQARPWGSPRTAGMTWAQIDQRTRDRWG